MRASAKHVPRGARADPKPWALDPELEQVVAERREARVAFDHSPTPENKEAWKHAKKKAAETEEEARKRAFRTFATEELNRPANLGRITKILRKMEGGVQSSAPGQAVNGDRGREVVGDRCKAEAFVSTYAAVSKHVRSKKWDRRVKAELKRRRCAPCSCGGHRTDACQPFKLHELNAQMKKMKPRKAPGPDQVCAEHLQHLGPRARETLLHLINKTWTSGSIPVDWRRATIIPIPKAGKNPKDVSSYRPIALTSCVAKLAERMVAARLTHLCELQRLIPPEQVGFRRGRAAEDNLARLVQSVQDGWNKPKARGRPVDGVTADKFVLVAYDFSRAYDTIDHRMLKLKLLKHLPRCLVTWVFQLLRDRRACVEVNGVRSRDRPFRAGLPQGSVLAPTLYTLWSADLIEELRQVTRTDTYMYADDTATVSAGATIEMALSRAQRSADVMARWATHNKMNIAGHKTQILVLSQWSRDAKDVSLKVAGSDVAASPHVKLLGVTLDRLLHFGEHCAGLRRKVRPRTAQLRKLTGHSWGLREHHLRTVANGYVRGALEYAAAAWLPAASSSHVELVDRELRAAARAVTGCPLSTPAHALMAEAGLPTAGMRRATLSTKMVMRAASLPPDDPLRIVASATPRSRLTAVHGWRERGRDALRELGALDAPVEPSLDATLPPWTSTEGISIATSAGPQCGRGVPGETRRAAAEDLLRELPGAEQATWIWSDGSATGGVSSGGGGALVVLPSGDTLEVRTPAGIYCSSTRAEMIALRDALSKVAENEDAGPTEESPIIACLDSQAALATLESGPAAQSTHLGADVWRLLLRLAERGRPVHLQWVPAHCGVAGNERADEIAKEAANLDQSEAPIDTRSATRAAARAARQAWQLAWPDGWYKEIFGQHKLPGPVRGDSRETAVDTHQLRAGHWSQSAQYLHRIGRRPTTTCPGCANIGCPAARCLVCDEEADTPRHVTLRCPCLGGARLHALGCIFGQPSDLRRDDVVAALAAGFRSYQSRSATPRR